MNSFKLTIDPYSVVYVQRDKPKYKHDWLYYIENVSTIDQIKNEVLNLRRYDPWGEDGFGFVIKFGIFFSFDDFMFEKHRNDNRNFICYTDYKFNGYVDRYDPYSINTGDDYKNKYYDIYQIIDYNTKKKECKDILLGPYERSNITKKCLKCNSLEAFMKYSITFSKYYYNVNQSRLNEVKSTLVNIDNDCHNYIIREYMSASIKECKEELNIISIPLYEKLTFQEFDMTEKDVEICDQMFLTHNDEMKNEYNYKWSFKVLTYYQSGMEECKLMSAEQFMEYNSSYKYGFFIPFYSELFYDCKYDHFYNFDNNSTCIYRFFNSSESILKDLKKIVISLVLSSNINNTIYYQSEEVIIDETILNHYKELDKINSYSYSEDGE